MNKQILSILSFDSLLRPLTILPATCAGILMIHHLEIFQVEPIATLKFIISFFLVFLPFCILAEFQIASKRPGALWALAIYFQCSFAALVFYKYIVGPSLLGAFRFRAIVLYAVIELTFLFLVGLVLFLRRRKTNQVQSLLKGLWSVFGIATWIMAFSVAIVILHRKFDFIPHLGIPVFSEKISDNSSAFGVEVFSENLDIENPTQIFNAPSSSAEFCVLTRNGQILAINHNDQKYEQKVVLDLSSRIGHVGGNELGAAGATFGPKILSRAGKDYVHLFVYYAFRDGDKIRDCLVSYEVSVPDIEVQISSERILIDQVDPHSIHNGGGIVFGPDGYLYIGLGDGGPVDDENHLTQKIDEDLFSGIIRIDVYGDDLSKVKPIEKQPKNGKTAGYWIPLTNPFIGQKGALEEYWVIGLRNPFRFSFLPNGEEVVVSDVGQGFYEEVNIISAGDNCQWSYREGPLPLHTTSFKGIRPKNLIGNKDPRRKQRGI